MILTYNEAVKKYGNSYKLTKAVSKKEIYKLEEGIYSTKGKESGLDILMKKYPNSILTGEYAFYCHGLTNVIPEIYDLATTANAAKIMDGRVHQVYVQSDLFLIGAIEMTIQGANVRIYDKERMLIELLRNKNKMPYDLYKEIIMNYRDIINSLEIWRIQEYASIFPKSKMISKALDEEVM